METHEKHGRGARGREKNAAEKKTNLNKKKGKRREKGGNPNAIKSPTMAPAEKVFALPESAAENQPTGARAAKRERERQEEQDIGRSRRGRRRTRKEDSEERRSW